MWKNIGSKKKSDKNTSKWYVSVIDISEIPKSKIDLVMYDWFDKDDLLGKQLDDVYIRIQGDSEEQIKARVELFKSAKEVRNGSGCRIKEVK